ncbi:MAG: SDR family oxidoreductase [Tatlockia sp.]|nr:SDR family oxidoreductase [Tatlockia sp.]
MKILITGANRGLGREIAKHLIQRNQQLNKPHSIHLTARQNTLQQLNSSQDGSFVTIYAMDLAEKDPTEFKKSIKSFPSFDYVIHTASPYSKSKLTEATHEELKEILTCQYNETILLTFLAQNLVDYGSLVAAGAIIGGVVGPDYIRSDNSWYIGLSSLHKSYLRAVMSSLYQELPNKQIIHANLGTFRENDEFAQEIAGGNALSTTYVAERLIDLAENNQKLQSFNINILTKKEEELLETFKRVKEEVSSQNNHFF